jgi:hypothetical protein
MLSERQLWHIYFVKNCRHAKPLPKDKLVVIVHIDATALGCFINSGISNWLRSRPNLLNCEASILAQEHRACLTYDSVVDCQDLYSFHDGELAQDRGLVSARAKVSILKAIGNCPTVPLKYKTAILIREEQTPKTKDGDTADD